MPFDDLKEMMTHPPTEHLMRRCIFWEVFSPPRIAPFIRKQGGQARRSVDVVGHWNLLVRDILYSFMVDLFTLRPFFVMLSPPCTYLSQLMFSNWNRMDPVSKVKELENGLRMVDISVWIAQFQLSSTGYFCFEHPAGAQTWSMQRALSLTVKTHHVFCFLRGKLLATSSACYPSSSILENKVKDLDAELVVFDQCRYGLVSKSKGIPVQKRTCFLTNSPMVKREFANKFCLKDHPHCRIEGAEGGMARSKWAQIYPDQLCLALSRCVMDEYEAFKNRQ